MLGFHGVRYQVNDASRAIAFYTEQLGFALEMQQLPRFAKPAGKQIQLEDPDGNPIELFEPRR